jgi:hypothetical protein
MSVSRVTCACYDGIAGEFCSVSEDHFVLEDLQIKRRGERVISGCKILGYRDQP